MASSTPNPNRPAPVVRSTNHPTPARTTPNTLNSIQSKIDGFLGSLGDVLNDITALEVNTMVVSEISGHKFNPEDAYLALYRIPDPVTATEAEIAAFFAQASLAPSLRDRYLSLRKKLTDAYNEYLSGIQTETPYPPLPDPERLQDTPRLQALLQDNQFLRSLRKLRELRHLMEAPEAAKNNIIDIISAQTVIQLDGDILNRFDQRLLEDPNKDFLLQVHKQAVISGEAQWRGLLGFVVNLVQDLVTRRRNDSALLPPNGKTSN